MTKQKFMTSLCLSLFMLVSLHAEAKIATKASDSKSASAVKSDTVKSNDTVLVKVNGMVCAFCAQGIKKKFNARDEVESSDVDLDKMQVKLIYKKGKSLDEKTIKSIIESSGFKFIRVES